MKEYRNTIKRVTAALLALVLVCGMAPALAESFSAIVTSNSTAVYRDVAMTEKAGDLKKNTVVRVVGYSATVAKISYQGISGYAKISDLKRVEDVADKAVTNAAAKVYKSPDTQSQSANVSAGTRLYVLAKSGEWAQVEKGGAVGYMKLENLADADDNWKTATDFLSATVTPQPTQENGITVRTYSALTVENTKVYKSASEKAKLLGTLKSGVSMTVLATSSNGWAYIELNGRKGFCKTDGIRESVAEEAAPAPTAAPTAGNESGTPGVVSAASLVVYEKASVDSNKLGTLKQGQEVNVLKWNGEWAWIELNGKYGYCSLAGLVKAGTQTTPQPTQVPSTANAQRGTVTAKTVTVYQEATTGSAKLGTLKKGQAVNVIQTSEGWAWIELNGKYGFCDAGGVAIDKKQDSIPAGFKKEEFTATVVTGDARAYSAASTDTENVALKRGAEVQVVAYNKTWACIKQNDKYAFVAVKALSRAQYDAISKDGTELQTLLKALHLVSPTRKADNPNPEG